MEIAEVMQSLRDNNLKVRPSHLLKKGVSSVRLSLSDFEIKKSLWRNYATAKTASENPDAITAGGQPRIRARKTVADLHSQTGSLHAGIQVTRLRKSLLRKSNLLERL
jgi:hypothetical protein